LKRGSDSVGLWVVGEHGRNLEAPGGETSKEQGDGVHPETMKREKEWGNKKNHVV